MRKGKGSLTYHQALRQLAILNKKLIDKTNEANDYKVALQKLQKGG